MPFGCQLYDLFWQTRINCVIVGFWIVCVLVEAGRALFPCLEGDCWLNLVYSPSLESETTSPVVMEMSIPPVLMVVRNHLDQQDLAWGRATALEEETEQGAGDHRY